MNKKNTFTSGTTTAEQQKLLETDNIRKIVLSFTGGANINLSN
ncbi:MAG: hypothetical protein U5N85_05800 [Arcicella sp.]|nr:hypothetical protein [Arcicella sp.]